MALNRRHFLAALACAAWPAELLAETAPDGFTVIRAGTRSLGLLEGGAGKTSAFMLGGGPAPAVIRATQGAELKLRFINTLPSEIWLHFFGLRGPSELMTFNVRPGEDQGFDCVFTPPDAGTFWVGPVADVSRMRDMGLVAMLIVEEAEALPGLTDLPLVLDDWKLAGDGAIENGFGDIEAMVGEGRLGNWFTVNNRFRPTLPLQAGHYTRLRILNAANVRSMGLLFKGQDPLLIARDGQPVTPRQLGEKALMLAPGQRADLLASPDEGAMTVALDLFEDVVEIAYLDPESGAGAPALADNFALPANPLSAPAANQEPRPVPIVIAGGIKGGLESARFRGETMDIRTLLQNGKGWAFNGVAGPSAEPLFVAAKGETVALDIENRTGFAQALHIHGHVWWLPAGEGQAPAASDTAVIAAGKTLRLTLVADNPGTWAIQSLVAERADGGLMAAFQVSEAEL